LRLSRLSASGLDVDAGDFELYTPIIPSRNSDLPPVSLDDCEPEPRPSFLRRASRNEDVFAEVFGNARPIVLDIVV